jgi:cytochrome c553
MKKIISVSMVAVLAVFVSLAFSAYHHEGETDSGMFLKVYADKAGTKLDSCALCHTGGQYDQNGKTVSLGSCQWCHYKYGYDKKGNILDTLNSYGKDYLSNGRNSDAIKAIESLDSDKDGFTNKAEIDAIRFPGNAADDPNKRTAPFRVYTKAQLQAMSQYSEFLLMNTSKSGDYYARYSGVPLENLLKDAGISDSATGITVFAPDGWSQYHPLQYSSDPAMYPIYYTYPQAVYQYDPEAEQWCDYSAPSCVGRKAGDAIPDVLKILLAYQRDGVSLTPGVLTKDNKLDGEGPYRVVVPQKTPSPPDQASNAKSQTVKWPYNSQWDHNAGFSSRSATIIRIEPLPAGTTDIDIMESGWNYIDQEKIVIYGAINEPVEDSSGGLCFISTAIH